MNLDKLVRPNILKLKPYVSARSEFNGMGELFLDANENPFETGFNRYPDPLQMHLKSMISEWKSVPADSIFLGNGSDQAIDLLVRIFCEPKVDNVITLPPTFSMFKVSAAVAEVEVRKVLLDDNFQPVLKDILAAIDDRSKILFLCSPNNPTGNTMDPKIVMELIEKFKGIIVIDEAYIDFSDQASYSRLIGKHTNLVVLQTFSKAMGLAGIRLGMAFATPEIIQLFNKVKMPYNVNQLTQDAALMALENLEETEDQVQEIISSRESMKDQLAQFDFVQNIYPSEANFLLVKFNEADRIYKYLLTQGIIVRNRTNTEKCEGCLRITIGESEENKWLLESLKEYQLELENNKIAEEH